MAKVIAVRCSSYDEDGIYCAMRAGTEALGGMRALIREDERILVKPNYLTYADPDRAVTTHPMVIKTMLRILHEDGYGHVTYGDSPGHGSNTAISDRLGVSAAATEYGAVPADMETEVPVTASTESKPQTLYLCRGAVEADAIINLCKMKTHQLERITGAVKNVYGLVCGTRKAAGHVKYPNASVFAGMIADIHNTVDIRLHIMDGVLAMEGNGPGSGDPVKMNVMLFATDPVALDAVFCSLIGLDPVLVPTCTQGQLKGIGTYDMNSIELFEACEGAEPEAIDEAELIRRFGKSDYDVIRGGKASTIFTKTLDMIDIFSVRPVINANLCVHCGICVKHCPVPGRAVDFRKGEDKPPVYDYRKCIRCFCCQEMCPQKAISARRGLFR